MSELIISYFVDGKQSSAYGQRVWQDGRVENYLSKRMIKGADGVYRAEKVAPDWYPVATLNTAQLDDIQGAINASNLDTLPEIVSGAEAITTGESATWKVVLDDGVKTIQIDNLALSEPDQAPLLKLIERMSQIVTAAQAEASM